MNIKDEIYQSIKDYKSGRLGTTSQSKKVIIGSNIGFVSLSFYFFWNTLINIACLDIVLS